MFLCSIPIDADFKLGQANENNMIEYTQQSILCLAMLIGLFAAYYVKNFSVLMTALSLFISIHLIRELDAWFDGLFPKIGWFPFVLLILTISFVVVIKNFNSFKLQLAQIKNTLGFGILVISLANLHVFTRLYGKPSNWENISGDHYLYSIERASEESVELIAYLMVLIAVTELYIHVKRTQNSKV